MTMSNSDSRKRLAEGVLPPTRTTKHRERLDEINSHDAAHAEFEAETTRIMGWERSLRVDLTLLRAGYERAAKELQGKPRSTGPRTVYLRVIADLRALLDSTDGAAS